MSDKVHDNRGSGHRLLYVLIFVLVIAKRKSKANTERSKNGIKQKQL